MRFGVDSKIKQIVDRMSQILFAAEVALRRLHGCMAQQELDLFQLTTAAVAELGTSPAQVMRCNMLQSRPLTTCLYDVPDHVLRDAVAPHLPSSDDRSENPARVMPASAIHSSSPALTQAGIGTVRIWPPLPIRSTIAQCPWRI